MRYEILYEAIRGTAKGISTLILGPSTKLPASRVRIPFLHSSANRRSLVETKVVFCHFKGVADLRAGFESFPVGTQTRTGSTGSIEKPSGFETVSRRCTG